MRAFLEKLVVLLTTMSYSQYNVVRFLIKLHFSYVIKIFFFSNINDGFSYVCFSLYVIQEI